MEHEYTVLTFRNGRRSARSPLPPSKQCLFEVISIRVSHRGFESLLGGLSYYISVYVSVCVRVCV